MALNFFATIFLSAAIFATSHSQFVVPNNILVADEPIYVYRADLKKNTTTFRYNIASDLRGFFILYENFKFDPNEVINVYDGNEVINRYRLASFYQGHLNGIKDQYLTFEKGQNLTVEYIFNTTTTTKADEITTTTPAEDTTPRPFAFMVSSYNETAAALPSPHVSGNFSQTVLQNYRGNISTYSGVTQVWHFRPAVSSIKLGFLLLSSNVPNTTAATLTVYRGGADNIDNTSTILKTYNSSLVADGVTLTVNEGETLSVYFNYPNATTDIQVYFSFIVSQVTDGGDVITLSPNSTVSGVTVPVNPNSTITASSISPPTTTTSDGSGAASFAFSLAPILIAFIFQLCQISGSPSN